jgi:type II secretory pathway pseudopilin PulG|tara:strand:- start:828 stop:1223 length:396 start_codon:yes stop_codon:yes gene_type:complete
MSKVLIGIIAVLLIIGYFLWNENAKLTALNQAFELRDQEQQAAIESLQNDFKLQTEGLLEIQSKNQAIEAEMARYLDVFKRHDLTKLAAAKPSLLEPRVNKGTKNVFDSIEEDSRNIDDLDDGLQLQPVSQ